MFTPVYCLFTVFQVPLSLNRFVVLSSRSASQEREKFKSEEVAWEVTWIGH